MGYQSDITKDRVSKALNITGLSDKVLVTLYM